MRSFAGESTPFQRITQFRVVATTQSLTIGDSYISLNNGATAITLTLPVPGTCAGHEFTFSRQTNSTGTVTINPGGGQIQALAGTMGASTSIGGHSAAGAGLGIRFVSDGTNWLRF